MPIGATSNMGWLSAGNGGSTVKKPVFLKSGWITTVDTSTNYMVWQLTAEQKAKLEGFTHPLFTVEVVMGWPDNPATTYYNISTFIREVGNQGWPTMLPATSTVAGTTIQSGSSGGFLVASGQYDYSLDIVGVLVSPGSGNNPQANTRCMFMLKVEEVDV